MVLTEAMKEAIWLQGLLDDLGIEQVYHVRTKHIDVRFHFVREILDDGDIELLKFYTTENPADILTKVVSRVKFTHCKALLHILPTA